MPSDLKGRKIKRANIDNSKSSVGYVPAAAVSKWDILVITGTSGRWYNMTPADADSARHASDKLFLATSPGRVETNPALKANGVCVPEGAIIGTDALPVDTSAATVGDPVYLSNTAGGWSLTQGTHKRKIGRVARVNATTGIIAFDGRSPGAGILSREVTITATNTNVAIAFDATTAGAPFSVTVMGTAADNSVADATLTSARGYWSGNNLIIEGNAAATADTDIMIMVHPS